MIVLQTHHDYLQVVWSINSDNRFRLLSINAAPRLLTFTAQPEHLPLKELLSIKQFCTSIDNPPPVRALLSTTAPTARPFRPFLQIAIFIHTTTADGKDNSFTKSLSSLPETGARAGAHTTETTRHVSTAVATRLGCARWDCTSCVGTPRVEVEITFCFGYCAAACSCWIHYAFGDFRDGEITVDWEEVLHARYEIFEVG